MPAIQGVLFDKDGTLFDFQATWSVWAKSLLLDLAAGAQAQAERLGRVIGYDFVEARFEPDSPVIAGTPVEIAEVLLPHLPGANPVALVSRMNALAATAPMAPSVPLAPFLNGLKAEGLRLGVATNDAEAPARAQLKAAGVEALFDFIAGSDSGHGAKPAPGQLLAFAAQHAIPPAHVVMVGDSRHDLVAGRAAGMRTVAVLTGIASEADLAPLAEVVLPNIGHLPHWLDTMAPAPLDAA
ncbi:HAD family hydrolase [Ostreiculturibacter nitratireducens]|uniref:HAD family hydrolase n=1 Tax=Ostreiculturibacter nitratireducens TaxID=3075226 RepID=UPI0031B62EBA